MKVVRAAGVLLVVVLASCAVDAEPEGPACTPNGGELFEDLDGYCMVAIRDGEIATRSKAVLPYDLATPGFSDYAVKRRTVWVPPGAKATLRDDEVIDFPVGSVLTKSFGFSRDASVATSPVRWLETRVLVRRAAGWEGVSYLWNDEQTAAHKQPGGAIRAFDVRANDGTVQHASYLVPSQQQCVKCHESDMAIVPIGTRASGLARGDQLARWTEAGILSGAPASSRPAPPAWDDLGATVDGRARAYLAANCAFCHNPKGEARTTGLYLTFEETDPARLGRCKSPVAAGTATADLRFDLVPGQPDSSLLLHRMIATAPSIAMPEIGRSVVHTEGVKLVREWIAGMNGDCTAK